MGLISLREAHPDKDYYMLVDEDTLLFRRELDVMMTHLTMEVLKPEEDLYLGHQCQEACGICKPAWNVTFICTGGGVLLRGITLRRAVDSGVVKSVLDSQMHGERCYWHLDWALGQVFAQLGVRPRGHPAFQQFADEGKDRRVKSACGGERAAVACHKYSQATQKLILRQHRAREADLTAAWALPCAKSPPLVPKVSYCETAATIRKRQLEKKYGD